VPPLAAAQRGADTYEALIDRYARGDQQDAPVLLARWGRADVTAAIGRAGRPRPGVQRAAAMLHTDAAVVLLAADVTALAIFHINAASRVLDEMKAGSRDARAQQFDARWHAFVASVYTSRAMIDYADRTLRDALTSYSREPLLYVARGALQEMRAGSAFVDLRSGNQIARRDRALEAAAADYRRAIGFDNRLAIAHLRLGSVHAAQRDDRARETFEAALASATELRDRYLAHLFLGGMAERENRIDDAQREYEAARALAPGCQTPYIALARIEQALGRPDRAREIATAFTTLPDKTNDPWWDYHLGGFDQVLLAWLRAEARIE
jgi:tetratricopeptide (TPR) repeat protein